MGRLCPPLFDPMNIILFKENELTNSVAQVTDRRLIHMIETLKVKEGDKLKAGIVGGLLGTAEVLSIDSTKACLRFSSESNPPAPLNIRLVLALPRPKVLRRVLYTVTCLGIKQIDVINAWRVEKSYWSSPLLSGLDEYLLPALEQARDTILPEIRLHRFFSTFVKDELPQLSKDTLRLAAHPSSTMTELKPTSEPITLVIGAEGGFIQKEIDTLSDVGFSFFSAGERILNVESAVPYILGRLL
jgi:16S rRNA (uracil1498-N3)-methyltransferase